jgi:hypothetical protein
MATEGHSVGDGTQQIAESGAKLLGSEKWEAGKRYKYVYVGATATAATPMMLARVSTAAQNPSVVALATSTGTAQYLQVAVPVAGRSTGDYDWVQIEGPCQITVASSTYTTGDGLKVHDGVVTDMGAAYIQTNTEFAAITVATTTATQTSITVELNGRTVLSTT